jgi:prepilin-type N-terminal cleavage/methylation domain-containing protein/prepilin-type processing-associated H-X9-DG protein
MIMRQQSGFTLIELLVVIAIISIIAAILFPVFAQAREKARQIACTSNEKQLSLGVLMYAQDFDDRLPPVATANNMQLWPDLVQAYIKNNNVRVCPDDTNAMNSYGLNQLVFVDFDGAGPNVSTSALAQFATPAGTVMLGELGTQADLKTPVENAYKLVVPDDVINDDADALPSARHFQRCNLAFMDGHAQALRLEQFYTNQTPPDKWFCWDPTNTATCHS